MDIASHPALALVRAPYPEAMLDVLQYRYCCEQHYEWALVADAVYWISGNQTPDNVAWRSCVLAALTSSHASFQWLDGNTPAVVTSEGQILALVIVPQQKEAA